MPPRAARFSWTKKLGKPRRRSATTNRLDRCFHSSAEPDRRRATGSSIRHPVAFRRGNSDRAAGQDSVGGVRSGGAHRQRRARRDDQGAARHLHQPDFDAAGQTRRRSERTGLLQRRRSIRPHRPVARSVAAKHPDPNERHRHPAGGCDRGRGGGGNEGGRDSIHHRDRHPGERKSVAQGARHDLRGA